MSLVLLIQIDQITQCHLVFDLDVLYVLEMFRIVISSLMILMTLSLDVLDPIVVIVVLEMYKIVLLVIETHFVNCVSKTLMSVLLGLVVFDLIA